MTHYEAVIGLEVHAQLSTKSKLFASSSTESGAPANTHTDPVTLGLPGCLPVLNRQVVDYAIKLGLATNCKIRRHSTFERKHYFYPDLPKGYQISQYAEPLCEHGYLDVLLDQESFRVGITRIHLEEDAGKSIHLDHDQSSIVDLNRAGVPLVEIVSEPDIRTSLQAGAYMRELRKIVRYLGVCDGNMEQGSLRCDANVSVRPVGESKLGTKVEIKNLNSFRFVEKALDFEIARQIEVLQHGGEIVQETRLWDEAKSATKSMRSKEMAEDYRYFPDPDLPPLVVETDWIDRIAQDLPELPSQVEKRFVLDYGIEPSVAQALASERAYVDYLEEVAESISNYTLIANWMNTLLFALLNRQNIEFADLGISPQNFAELLKLIESDTISGAIGKKVFEEMFTSGESASQIVKRQGLEQISDTGELQAAIEEVIASSEEQVQQWKDGKEKVWSFFVGQVMKKTKGKANPQVVNQLLRELLDKE